MLIEEIRDRFSFVPGFKRFSLNCMAHAATHYLIIIVVKYTCLWCRLTTCLINYEIWLVAWECTYIAKVHISTCWSREFCVHM